jgi:hypothetical protein
MKKIKLIVIGSACLILLGVSSYAQQANSNLHLPKEFDEMGKMVDGSFKYIFSRVSEYVNGNDVITKEGMDSVTRVATLDFVATLDTVNHSMVADMLSGKKPQHNISDNPELKAMKDEMMNVVKKSSGNFDELAIQLGAINQKAAANLSEKEAVVIYATTCMAYYSAKYWMDKDNMKKWQKLNKDAKKKAKK